MIADSKCGESISPDELESGNKSSPPPLFPYPFVFRSQDQLDEHISNKLTSNKLAYYTKLILGFLTLILPIFNVFTVYRSMIYQRKDFSDTYSAFHSIIFYGEFVLVHVLLLVTWIRFIIHSLKNDYSSYKNKGQWINLLDVEFTYMAFNMIKLIPILSVNGFNFLFIQISVCAPVFRKYSRSSQILAFIILFFAIFIQLIFLLGILMLTILVKVYQVSFVGETTNPLGWTISQWLLFIGFAANIINITDTPTISQLSFMWSIINRTWSEESDIWLHDQLATKREIYLFDQISRTLGFIKAFLWVRTMTANDLHCLIRLPPSVEHSSEHM